MPSDEEPGAVERIGRRLVDAGLGRGDSLLTPGQAIWTLEHLTELQQDFVDKPDEGSGTFFDKLTAQLESTSPDAIQLFAELYIMNVLPIVNLTGKLKVQQVDSILDLCTPRVALPADVEQALLVGGVYHGGQAFNNYRWKQLAYLIEFAKAFLSLSAGERSEALDDPLKFRAVANSVATGQAAQRQSLLYLGFPDFFLPIVSPSHRRQIRDAFAADYLDHPPTDDVDVDLHEIHTNAAATTSGDAVDFYSAPWSDRWQQPKATAASPSDQVVHAWKVYGSNVAGEDMVPIWRTKGTVSLAAKFLRPVESDVTRDELKGFIEEDYRASGYAARQEKLDEFYSFLARMHPGDLVVTVSQGKAHFGTVTGDAEYVQSTDGRSNLRRPVKWESVTRPSTDLPLEIASRLNAQGEVVDLTPQIDALREIFGQRRAAKPATGLNLPDASADLARRLHVPQEWLQECVDLLRDRPQLIFYGPPGTGKTYIAKELARHLAGESNVKIVQFHPAYSYEDFFEGYRPAQQVAGQVGFELRPGPLRTIVDRATDNPDAVYVLIIDEINRGNLAKIFGELYFLLEYRNESIDLLYGSDNTEPFMLPRNVILIGTMNTADRSIALVDAAMRRRFAFLPLHPSEPPTSGILRSWLQATNRKSDAADLLDILNARIDDEDFKIGPSYLMRDAVYHEKGLDRVWRTAILPLLEEFHYGDRGIDVQLRYGLDALRKTLSTNDFSESGDDTNDSDTD
ncbi:AAA family ATPase [Rhodococcus sp. Eu-32]|uniref:McrB family protein n=1 Tax=Rhodococcus sp. Eu-32 TaxID=1017319 RepID=UPI000DF32BC7|nr:AAA family ATPase [Rhodococcus sp. Eu-32]RRQ27385.1 AAA family ATPase [Rhodococcus sp. Eu-32]